MTKNLDELKKKYKEMGEEIERLEREPEGFLGIKQGDICYELRGLAAGKSGFISTFNHHIDNDSVSRGYLNVFKTKEQAEAARYCLIDILNDIKENIKNNYNVSYGFGHRLISGKRIAKELGLE